MNILNKIYYSTALLVNFSAIAYAQFPPPAGQAGSTAIYKDSTAIIAWATTCTVTRGYKNIAMPDSGFASAGTAAAGVGNSDGNVVSLGDGGEAIVTFAQPITDGAGWDFCVFENGFQDNYLELAFVEVSSDGQHFFRFHATSNTQTQMQTDGFGYTDATKLNNLAGKYRLYYGTPFDLEELKNETGLDIHHITHVKIIDVVGSIDTAYARHDYFGHKINDPWPTPYASGGFDLDAVGVIHQQPLGIKEQVGKTKLVSFPNPFNTQITIKLGTTEGEPSKVLVKSITGTIVYENTMHRASANINTSTWPTGLYFVEINTQDGLYTGKIVKQ